MRKTRESPPGGFSLGEIGTDAPKGNLPSGKVSSFEKDSVECEEKKYEIVKED